MEPFIGQIIMFAGNFAPRGWAMCDGQLMPITQNTALFSILGTTYGGDGRVNFGLPDLRGRFPLHPGSGPGLSPRWPGESGGVESVTIHPSQMPAHNHGISAAQTAGNVHQPGGNFLAAAPGESYATGGATSALNATSVAFSGGNEPHENMPPYMCIHFIICLEGIYPSRL